MGQSRHRTSDGIAESLLMRSHARDEVSLKTNETIFVCQNCGHQSRKWLGKCPECGEWNSLVEERARATQKGSGRNTFQTREVEAIAYSEIESQHEVRMPSGVTEFDRVLGGGIVPGTLVLIGGRHRQKHIVASGCRSTQRPWRHSALRFRRRV